MIENFKSGNYGIYLPRYHRLYLEVDGQTALMKATTPRTIRILKETIEKINYT